MERQQSASDKRQHIEFDERTAEGNEVSQHIEFDERPAEGNEESQHIKFDERTAEGDEESQHRRLLGSSFRSSSCADLSVSPGSSRASLPILESEDEDEPRTLSSVQMNTVRVRFFSAYYSHL